MQAPGGPEEDTSGGFKFGGWSALYADEASGKLMRCVETVHQGICKVGGKLNTKHFKSKAFPSFGLAEGQTFSECDLVYISNGLLFWGARNVDGRGVDNEDNRPTNLQIPLMKRS